MSNALTNLLLRAEEGEPLTAKEAAFLVTEFKKAEALRLAADKEAAKLKETEVRIKLTLINTMKLLEITAVGAVDYKCEYSTIDEPTVVDWKAYYAYILKTKDFSLLERRPGKAAIKERWNDGKAVPGIDKFPVDKLSFTKLKG